MARFIIKGGRPLTGDYRPPGNKNAALPMLAASVLTDEPVTLRNVPRIEDVQVMLAILDDLGADVSYRGHTVTICASGLRRRTLNPALCGQARSSILFAGPMAARYGRVTLDPPGGDVIGRRRLDTHFDALAALGIELQRGAPFRLRRRNLRGADILLDEASVTATENAVMAAVLAPGETTIFNAACEPHVQNLCSMLNRMGAAVRGIGTNYLRIRGVERLGGVNCRIPSDYIDAAGMLAAAAVTGGDVSILDAPIEQLAVVARPFRKLGVSWSASGKRVSLSDRTSLRIRNDLGAAIPKVEDGTWPSFPSDLMSAAIVTATQARGTVLFFEKLFESRMYFVDRLIAMGARIVQCDPHRVIVAGNAPLHGIHMSSPDIRAGMALILAALCAKGESIIDQAQIVDRGYEKVDATLRKLGADIVRED